MAYALRSAAPAFSAEPVYSCAILQLLNTTIHRRIMRMAEGKSVIEYLIAFEILPMGLEWIVVCECE